MRHPIGKSLGIFVCAFAMVLIYQNCGSMSPAPGFSDEESLLSQTDPSPAVASADLAWSMRGRFPEFNSFNRAERWADMKKMGLNLYPPLIPNTQSPNMDASGLLVKREAQSFLRIQPDASMQPSAADLSEFVFDEATVVIIIKDLEVSTAAGEETVRLFSLFPANGENAGVLVLDVSRVSGGYEFGAVHWFAGAHAARKMIVTEEELKGPIAIAARFGNAADRLQIAVNGRLASEDLILENQPTPLASVVRRFSLHHMPPDTFGSKGSFSVGEFGIYRRALADERLISLSRQMAFVWGKDSAVPIATPQPAASTPVPGEKSGAELYQTHCAACHGAASSSTKRGRSAAQIKNAIRDINQMNGLSGLSDADLAKIADAIK